MIAVRTIVHLVRHGEVYNPEKVLYGRLPGYHLSDRGVAMAQAAADYLADNDVTVVIASSLTRARESAAPIAAQHALSLRTDDRVIEADNDFEGQQPTLRNLLRPRNLRRLGDFTRPSWGEPYDYIAKRMRPAIEDARDQAHGHEAVIVSHQLPIWIARLDAEGRRLWHDPRSRQCGLASVTSFTYAADELAAIAYAEPAAHLVRDATASVGA